MPEDALVFAPVWSSDISSEKCLHAGKLIPKAENYLPFTMKLSKMAS